MLRSMAATKCCGASSKQKDPCWDPQSEERTQVLFIDISRASFNAKKDVVDPIYVGLPTEVGAPPGMCALLKRHTYGTRRDAEG